jgi:hypothetical protein
VQVEERLGVVQRCVAREMARFGREFQIDGPVVRGPGTTAVAVREHADEEHLDLGYVLELGRGDAPVVWDCTAGSGRTEEERLANAVSMWATTTAAAVVELLERRGEHGDHFPPGSPGGVPGWHAVQGPACVFGFRAAPLGDWLADNHVLPAVAGHVLPLLPAAGSDARPPLHAVRFFFGGRAGDEVADVRLDGRPVATASAALGGLDWPRGKRLAWARFTVLLAADPSGFAHTERDSPRVPPQRTEPPLQRSLISWLRRG